MCAMYQQGEVPAEQSDQDVNQDVKQIQQDVREKGGSDEAGPREEGEGRDGSGSESSREPGCGDDVLGAPAETPGDLDLRVPCALS